MQKIFVPVLFIIIMANISYSQSNINPDISLIGTFNTYTNFSKGSIGYGKLNFDTPSMELFVDSYLNPYAKAAGNISYEDRTFGVEELYAEIVRGLPLDIQIKAGKFLVGFGKLNTVHPHAWAFLDRPLVHQIYFGPDGFNDIGFNFSFILPTTDFYSSLDLGIFKGDAISKNEVSDPENYNMVTNWRGKSPIFVGRLGTFFSLTDYSNLEVGLSASYGVHAKAEDALPPGDILSPSAKSSLNYFYGGLDFKYKYRPDGYTALTIQGEGILNNRNVLRRTNILGNNFIDVTKDITTNGAYIYIDYLFNKTYSLGAKYDYTYGIIGDTPGYNTLSNDNQNTTKAVSGWIGYYPVEHTLAFRLGVQHLSFNLANGLKKDGETTVTLQMVFSLGPHKAHPF